MARIGTPVGGAIAAHDPVVAPFGRDLRIRDLGRPDGRCEVLIPFHHFQIGESAPPERISVPGPHRADDFLGDDAHVEAFGDLEIIPWIGRCPPIRFLGAETAHVHREAEFTDRMAPDTRQPDLRPTQHHGLGSPRIRLDSSELELDRQIVSVLLDVSVDPVGVGREDALPVRVIARPLGLVPRAAEHHLPGAEVVVERLRSEDLGEAPLVPAPPHFHLPEPVLGHHVPLRQEEVVVVLSVDVRDSPLISDDLDRFPQAGDVQLSTDLSQRPACQLLQGIGLRRWGATSGQEQQTHHHTSESAWIEGHGTSLTTAFR